MDVPLISDRAITPFRFWFEGDLHDGMQFQGELFRRLELTVFQDLESCYRLGMALQQRQVETVITHSETRQIPGSCYTIWINLRTTDPGSVKPDAEVLSMACSPIAHPTPWVDHPLSPAGSRIGVAPADHSSLG